MSFVFRGTTGAEAILKYALAVGASRDLDRGLTRNQAHTSMKGTSMIRYFHLIGEHIPVIGVPTFLALRKCYTIEQVVAGRQRGVIDETLVPNPRTISDENADENTFLTAIKSRAHIWMMNLYSEQRLNKCSIQQIEEYELLGEVPTHLTDIWRWAMSVWSTGKSGFALKRTGSRGSHYCTKHRWHDSRKMDDPNIVTCRVCRKLHVTTYDQFTVCPPCSI